jgi:hypothetical protein
MFNVQAVKMRTPAAVRLWASRVKTNGAGFESNSMVIASNLLKVLQTRSYFSKIKYLLPLLGRGIGAARVPLIDVLNVGSATSTAFVDADFSQSTGLQGNGSTKYLDSLIKPSQIGTSSNGGLGYWENNINLTGNVQPMGTYKADDGVLRFVLDLRTTRESFRWGNAANEANSGASAANGHYYGQRIASNSRAIYENGVSIATNTTNDANAAASNANIIIVGCGEAPTVAPWPGRCAVAYMTDGTLSASEISDLDALLRSYLFAPTGRPTS